ncbi:cell division protein FtsK, partial [Micromonospora echinospora]
MTPPNDDRRFDWQAAEADLHATGPDADVVDLDAARAARTTGPAAEDGGPVLVDSPAAQRSPRFTFTDARAGQRRPILPGWLRSRDELRDVMRWTVGHLLHTSAYHLVRVPKYLGKLAWRAPVGAWRLLSGAARWLF